MASPGRSRPAPFQSGTPIGENFRVEALVRLAEGRMFYLVTDDRAEKPRRPCWECGHPNTPRAADACESCESPFQARTQFLMSVRWHKDSFQPYMDFFNKGVKHPGLLSPDACFIHAAVLCSVVRDRGESLMLDEAAPLSARGVVHLGQRFAGMLASLQYKGITLAKLSRANVLLRRSENRLLLFDPDIARVHEGPVPEAERGHELRALGRMLRMFTPVNANHLRDFFAMTEEGAFASPLEFGRAIEKQFDDVEELEAPAGIAAMTDVGLARSLNEDNWGWVQLSDDSFLYVIADGMGGHDSGEVASELATATLCRVARERMAENPDMGAEDLESLLDESFQMANNTVKGTAEARGNDMGTTLVALLVKGKLGFMANVGDSRGYLYRQGQLHQISKDHSLVGKMVEQGRITSEEARVHPHSNILLRTVGTERDVEIDIFRIDLQSGDRVMMNTDGLWGEVEDERIRELMEQYPDPRVCGRELVRAAHHGGGKDNVTLMIVGVP